MPQIPTTVALAVLIFTSGIGGLVVAEPTGSTAPETDSAARIAPETGRNATDLESRVRERLDRFDLTDEQVDEIVTEAEALHDEGASRLVIRSMVVTKLWAFGVDAPALYADPVEKRLAWLAGEFDLTDEQVDGLEELIREMRADGADSAEIREAVLDQLAEYGIEEEAVREAWREHRVDRARHVHDRAHRLGKRAHDLHHRAYRLHDAVHHAPVDGDRITDRVDDRYDLTDGQAAEVEELIREMRADGADRAEIRDAVREYLRGIGVEVPADAPVDG